MLIDTGAELTICTKKLADKIGLTYRQDKVIELITVDGKKNRTCGVAEEANIKIADAMVPMNIHIADSKDETFLIGGDWLNRYQADLSYGKKEVTFKAQGRKITVKLTTNQPKQKVNYLGVRSSPPPPYQPTIEISDDDDDSGSDDESVAETYTSARSRITEILNDLEQRERRGQQAISKEDLETKINLWMVKCAEMKQVIRQYKAEKQLLIPKDELMAEMESKMEAAQWEEITGESPTAYLAEQEPDESAYNFHIEGEEEEEEDDDIAKEVEELLREYQDIVSKGDHDIGNCDIVEHAIRLIDDIPTTCRLRPRSPKENEWIEVQIKEMLKNGVIEKSKSPYTANVVVVGKKDGDGEGMDRLCVNFGLLNRKTISDRYPLPIIMELLRLFWECKYYTVIDLKAAYWQVPVREQDRKKTAFRTVSGYYQFRVMPFGLNNALVTFQRLMNDVLRDYLRKFVAVYLDDIIIFSKDKESHKRHVKKVLNKIRGANLKIKITKCQWFLN